MVRSGNSVLQSLLREMRENAGLRQEDLARVLQKPQSFVSKYESGERRLDVLEVRDICFALNVPFPELAQTLDERLSGEHT